MWIWILYPSARENKKSKPTILDALALFTTQPKINNLVENVTQEKNHTEIYLVVCFVLLMLKLNRRRYNYRKAYILFAHIST